MTDLTQTTPTELILDSRVSVGFITIDGASLIFMKLEHPRHGELAFNIPRDAAKALYGLLIQMTNETVQ